MDSKLFTKLAAIPILAIFLGSGVLFVRIAIDWETQDTRYLLGGVLTVCGAGLGIFAAILGITVGIGLCKRIQQDTREPPPPRDWRELPYQSQGYRLSDLREPDGSWISSGEAAYDLWPEEEEAWRGR